MVSENVKRKFVKSNKWEMKPYVILLVSTAYCEPKLGKKSFLTLNPAGTRSD